MNNPITRKTAILIDGGFYRKRAVTLWGTLAPKDRATEMIDYCMRHINEPDEPRDLQRIFYYDCPPLSMKIMHPLTKLLIDTVSLPFNTWTADFQKELAGKHKIALRMGELSATKSPYALNSNVVNDLVHKKRNINNLTEADFHIAVKQKGVDLRIGLDTASLAYGRYVDQIILIAGDSDFIPVAKMARRHGINFILDPLKNNLKPNFLEHVDELKSYA